MTPHTVLFVPVPGLELASLLGGPGPDDAPPHVTVFGPFVDLAEVSDELLGELATIAAAAEPFSYELSDVDAFPGGLAHLVATPAAPFLELMNRFGRSFPEWPPYEGRFARVVPHLTLGTVPVATARAALASSLLIRRRAIDVTLFWWDPGASRPLAHFPLGVTTRPQGDRTTE